MKLDEATRILTKNGYILENSDLLNQAIQAYEAAKDNGAFMKNYFSVQPGEDEIDEGNCTYKAMFIDGYLGRQFNDEWARNDCENYAYDIDARDDGDEDDFINMLVSEYRDAYELGKAYAKENEK